MLCSKSLGIDIRENIDGVVYNDPLSNASLQVEILFSECDDVTNLVFSIGRSCK